MNEASSGFSVPLKDVPPHRALRNLVYASVASGIAIVAGFSALPNSFPQAAQETANSAPDNGNFITRFFHMAGEEIFGPAPACATSLNNGTLRMVQDGPGAAFLQESYRLAQSLPHYNVPDGQHEQFICVASRSPSGRLGAGSNLEAGSYDSDLDTTTFYQDSFGGKVNLAASKQLHERMHARYAKQPQGIWAGFRKTGGDDVFDRMIDEGHAFTREIESAYVYYLRHNDNTFYEPLKFEAYAFAMRRATRLYDPAALKAYAMEHDALPPFVVRTTMIATMAGLQKNIYIDTFESLLKGKSADIRLLFGTGDDYLRDHANFVNGNIGEIKGAAQYMLNYTVLGAALRGHSMRMEADQENARPEYIWHFMDSIADMASEPNDARAAQMYQDSLRNLNTSGELDYPFVSHDLAEGMAALRGKIEAGDLPPVSRAMRLGLVEKLEHMFEIKSRSFCDRPATAPGKASSPGLVCE